MVKFSDLQFRICVILISFLSVLSYAQKKETLQAQLWQRVLAKDDLSDYDNSVKTFLNSKGWQQWEEWSGAMNSNVLTDDAKNGYLRINRFYRQTTLGAYKDDKGKYTILQNEKFRHFTRGISSNRNLESIFPEDFGIADFILDQAQILPTKYSCFYLEAVIPRKGTDTQVNLKLIPFGLFKKGNVLTYEFKELNNDNVFLYEFINSMVKKLNNENTLSQLMDKKFAVISEKDKRVVDQFIKKDNQFKSIEDLSKLLTYFKSVYKLNSEITYKSIILGWNSNAGSFFVKDQIKNDNEELSFKSFLENAEYYMALQ